MTERSRTCWPVNAMHSASSTELQGGSGRQRGFPQEQAQHQSYFMPSAASHLMHPYDSVLGPELQLEYFHDKGGIDGFGSHSYNAFPPQNSTPQIPVLGVGQGAGNAEPKYTAATATALAAHACPPDVFQFGRNGGNSSHVSNTGLESFPSGRPEFGDGFSFSTVPSSSTASSIPEGVSPHEAFRGAMHTSDTSDPSNNQKQKRRRDETGNESLTWTGSQADDGGAQYDLAGKYEVAGQSPEILSQIHPSLTSMDRGAGITFNASQRTAQGDPDNKLKPMHRAACVRCKNLKVRCEFITDPNTCRRCLNGGHECAIPGRKKRRQPPKREHLLNQIKDQAQQINNLERQLEEHRRARMHNEPTRLSLSNTPLPRSGATFSSRRPSASYESGSLPQPDVQAWIERARESIQALSALVEGEEDIEEDQEEEDAEGDEYHDDQGSEHTWRESPLDRDTDTEEYGISVEEPEVTSQLNERRSASPAMIVHSASHERSTPPRVGQAIGRGIRRKTPQPSRLANLPETPAAPLKLIADLSISAAGGNKLGSKSPSAPPSGTSSYSRGSSIEVDGASTPNLDNPSPKSTGEPKGSIRVDGTELVGDEDARDGPESTSDEEYGAAAPGFFTARRGSVLDPSRLAPARHPVPHILMRNIVTPQEVESLFKIYFDKMNLSCSLLDPVLYTAQTTYWRSPFLFTVICAVASRYYAERPKLYEKLITYAQLAAGTALINGPKTVETVSAYILLSLYPVPMRRWEEDRTWLYLGLAIRVATDLNLHHPSSTRPRNEQHERELLNRTRVWLNCCNLDISTSSWHGKASTIPARDYVACHSESWFESSQYNLTNFDIHICGYNFELRLMRSFKEKIYSDPNNPTGLNKNVDFISLSSETDEILVKKEEEWSERLREKTDPGDSQGRFRNSLLRLAYRYARLTVLSFGFQHSFGKGGAGTQEQVSFFDRCYRAATDVVCVFIDELSTQKEYIRHGPEAQCVFVTFASAFLIKLLHPKYAGYLRLEQRKEIERLIRGIISLLGSPEVVVDDRHSPKLWSRFLDGLLAIPTAKVELSPSAMKGGSSLPRRTSRRPVAHTGSSPSLTSSSSSTSGLDNVEALNEIVSYPSPDSQTSSPASGYSGARSPPPAALASTVENRYSAPSNESPRATFNLGNHHQRDTSSTSNSGFGRAQQSHQGMYDLQNSLHMNVPEFFQPPLPFDNDLLQSMQTMPDTSIWQNMPGFNWMGVLQSNDQDSTMQDVLASSNFSHNISSSQIESVHY